MLFEDNSLRLSENSGTNLSKEVDLKILEARM